MSELNPDHPVLEKLRDQWHKVCLVLMLRLKEKEIVITSKDIDAINASPYKNIIAHERHDGLHIILATDEEAHTAVRRSVQ